MVPPLSSTLTALKRDDSLSGLYIGTCNNGSGRLSAWYCLQIQYLPCIILALIQPLLQMRCFMVKRLDINHFASQAGLEIPL
jgi:hypothetical protein